MDRCQNFLTALDPTHAPTKIFHRRYTNVQLTEVLFHIYRQQITEAHIIQVQSLPSLRNYSAIGHCRYFKMDFLLHYSGFATPPNKNRPMNEPDQCPTLVFIFVNANCLNLEYKMQ